MKTIHQDDSPQNISEELHTANAVDEGSERSVGNIQRKKE